MKIRYLIIYIFIFVMVGALICLKIANGFGKDEMTAETTEINRLVIQIQENWDSLKDCRKEKVEKSGTLDYAVIDNDSDLKVYSNENVSQTISAATTHYDIIRDVEVDGEIVGKVIIHNPSAEEIRSQSKKYAGMVALMLAVALLMLILYSLYIRQRVIAPFKKLKSFATRVASGDLDSPLEMDRGHVFGEFTEAFDIMREELKISREREEAAVRSRKELVAELSHDIKTPVASIKAMADVMSLTARDDMERDTISAINGKADQIDRLISNLFHATLEELEQLEVNVEELETTYIRQMITDADYMKRVVSPDVKDAVLVADKLRLSQVITNVISNSYKYAGTDILIGSSFEDMTEGSFFVLEIEDKGEGVPEEELDHIMEKFKRGSNAQGKDGSGLGLYISNYLMEKMGGSMSCNNTENGFKVTLRIRVA